MNNVTKDESWYSKLTSKNIFYIFVGIIFSSFFTLIIIKLASEYFPVFLYTSYDIESLELTRKEVSQLVDLSTIMSYYDTLIAHLSLVIAIVTGLIFYQVTTVRNKQIDDRIEESKDKLSITITNMIKNDDKLLEEIYKEIYKSHIKKNIIPILDEKSDASSKHAEEVRLSLTNAITSNTRYFNDKISEMEETFYGKISEIEENLSLGSVSDITEDDIIQKNTTEGD
jgi:hypothetical protein